MHQGGERSLKESSDTVAEKSDAELGTASRKRCFQSQQLGRWGDPMDERGELEALAAKCRQLASGLTDGNARKTLLELADDYERRARPIPNGASECRRPTVSPLTR